MINWIIAAMAAADTTFMFVTASMFEFYSTGGYPAPFVIMLAAAAAVNIAVQAAVYAKKNTSVKCILISAAAGSLLSHIFNFILQAASGTLARVLPGGAFQALMRIVYQDSIAGSAVILFGVGAAAVLIKAGVVFFKGMAEKSEESAALLIAGPLAACAAAILLHWYFL